MRTAVVVGNPRSGGGRGSRLLGAASERLQELGLDHEVVITTSLDHARRASREATSAGARALVAVGGDGLVGACAEGLAGTDTSLAVVPAGSGNDFARALHLDPGTPLWALDLLSGGVSRRIDAVRAEGPGWHRHYVCVAGAGFDSEANEVANRIRRLRGAPRYVVAVFRTLARFRPARFEIRVDGREHALDAMMVAVGNASSYGGGMRVVPDARVDDGRLDICVVGAMARRTFVATFPKVFRGTHVTHPKVTMLTGQKVELEASRPFQVYADGERAGPLPASFTVLPHVLEVVAP